MERFTNSFNCSTTDSVTVTETFSPVASFTYGPNGSVVTFINLTLGGTSYFWDFGDGHTAVKKVIVR